MPWIVTERKIGRAGSPKQRLMIQKKWNEKYGEDNWETGYMIDGQFVSQENALDIIYYQSYKEHFENKPEDLTTLLKLAKKLRNPHAESTGGVDLQLPAISKYLVEKKT